MKMIGAKYRGSITKSQNSKYKIIPEARINYTTYKVYQRLKFLIFEKWEYIKECDTLEEAEKYVRGYLEAEKKNKNPLIKYYE